MLSAQLFATKHNSNSNIAILFHCFLFPQSLQNNQNKPINAHYFHWGSSFGSFSYWLNYWQMSVQRADHSALSGGKYTWPCAPWDPLQSVWWWACLAVCTLGSSVVASLSLSPAYGWLVRILPFLLITRYSAQAGSGLVFNSTCCSRMRAYVGILEPMSSSL